MKNIQFIKVNDDSSIKVEYLKTTYLDVANPDNLIGQDLLTYVTAKIAELHAQEDFLDPEEGILETLELTPVETETANVEFFSGMPEMRKW